MTRVFVAVACVGLAGCGNSVATVGGINDEATLEGGLSTQVFATTTILKGASRRGTVTSKIAGELVFRASGTGDVDLYLKKGSAPTTSSFDKRAAGPTSAEEARVTVAVGDVIHYLVYGYVTSTARLEVVTPDSTAVTSVELVPHQAIARGASKTGIYVASSTGRVTFKSTGTGDLDLYVRKGAPASSTAFDAKGEGPTAVESVALSVNAGDQIHYNVYGYVESTGRLVVEVPATEWSTKLSLPTMAEAGAFQAFSTPGGGLSSSGRSLKFLIDYRTASRPTMAFINGNYRVNGVVPDHAKYHYYFAQRAWGVTDGTAVFNDSTYFSTNKRFFAGSIQSYRLGDAEALTYAVQFYPDDVISEETLLNALKIVQATFGVPGKLIFVATGHQQTFARIGTQAAQLGIELKTIDQVLGDLKYLALNTGEAWGYLRIFPADLKALRPTDIPVFDDLPLDLSVVAGTITRAYQDVNSHVNLKAKERNTPNMVLRDVSAAHAVLGPYANQPVHLTVTNEGFSVEPTTDALVNQKLAEKLSGPWLPLPVVDESRLLSFDQMCPLANASCFAHSPTLGGKSTGLGFLAGALGRASSGGSVSAQTGYDLSPRGVGVPVKFYRDLVNAPENAALKVLIADLVQAEKGGLLSPLDRETKAAAVQSAFYKAHVPGSLVADVTARLATVNPGVVDFKFRSSATSEDIANFNGAGLYDSFAVETTKEDNADRSCRVDVETDGPVTKLKVKPKSVQCGIKAVYASLWNPRALLERSFARLDHVTAGMGIAINPSYGDEQANLVLVTRVVGTDLVYGYTLSVQKGENLVTNPLPGTMTEFDVATFSDVARPPRISTTRYAKPSIDEPVMTTTILSQARMVEIVQIAKKIEIAYCKAKPSYYPGGNCEMVWGDAEKPLSLDMEIKVLPDGNLQFKQAREFHGR